MNRIFNHRLAGNAALLTAFAPLAFWSGPAPLRAQETLPEATVGEPSPGLAQTTSVLATVVPLATGLALQSPELFAAGIYFGPATGYWVGGVPGRGWQGVGLRAGTSAIGSLLMRAAWGDDWDPSGGATAIGIGVLGVLAYLIVDDIVAVDNAVATRNAARAAARQALSMEIAPVVSPSGGGTLGVVGRLRL